MCLPAVFQNPVQLQEGGFSKFQAERIQGEKQGGELLRWEVLRGIQEPSLVAGLDPDALWKGREPAALSELNPNSPLEAFPGRRDHIPSKEFSVDQKSDLLRNGVEVIEVMGSEKQGAALGDKAVQDAVEGIPEVGIEGLVGFIQDEEGDVRSEGDPKSELLFHPGRIGPDLLVQRKGEGLRAELLNFGIDSFMEAEPEFEDISPFQEIVEGVFSGEKTRGLADAEGVTRDAGVLETDLTRVELDQAEEAAKKSALARPVGADESKRRALLQLEVQIPKNSIVSECFVEGLGLQEMGMGKGSAHWASRTRRRRVVPKGVRKDSG